MNTHVVVREKGKYKEIEFRFASGDPFPAEEVKAISWAKHQCNFIGNTAHGPKTLMSRGGQDRQCIQKNKNLWRGDCKSRIYWV